MLMTGGNMAAEPIILSHGCAPGDIICMTALVRDIARAYPGRYGVEVLTTCPSLWEHNPHVSRILSSPRAGVRRYELKYGNYITEANHTHLHFFTAFHREFERLTGLHVPVTEPKPDLHLSEYEKSERLIDGRYWLMFAGGKSDFTNKIWSAQYCQQVVNGLAKFGIPVVQTGATHRGNWHPPIYGTLNIVGKAGLRDTLRLIYHADGVLCPITFGMHAAAAFERPCVIWAGGREHWWWEAYTNHPTIQHFGPHASGKVKVPHKYLHTQGLLACCKNRGCWMNKVTKNEPDKHKRYCALPVDDGYGQTIPQCHKMVTPLHVLEAALSYYKEGILEPIGDVPTIITDTGETLTSENLAGIQPELFEPETTKIKRVHLPRIVNAFEGQSRYVKGANAQGMELNIEHPMDNHIIGGKFTCIVNMRDKHDEDQRQCLGSILRTLPQEHRDVRVLARDVSDDITLWLHTLVAENQITIALAHDHDKYVAMRALLHDTTVPITTPYLVWFDDIARADKDSQWWLKLAQTIINYHPEGCRLYGAQAVTKTPAEFVKARAWYKSRNFRLANGAESAKGDKTILVYEPFWAIHMDAVREADIPDPMATQPGGEVIMAEQLWQAGYKIKHWNGQKQFISWTAR